MCFDWNRTEYLAENVNAGRPWLVKGQNGGWETEGRDKL